jgi:hypothetical protein
MDNKNTDEEYKSENESVPEIEMRYETESHQESDQDSDHELDHELDHESDQELDQELDHESDQEYEKEKEPIKVPEIDYSKMFKEVNILNNIKTYITYINSDNEIEIINQKKIYLNNDDNIVTRNQLIEVIKNSQKKHNIKYKLISIMVYNIHVTPESLPSYIENPNDFISLYTLNRIESFELQPTLRLLKKYNGIYFFFFECPEQVSYTKSQVSSQEVLSNGNNSFIKNKNNNTKRIHIHSSQKEKKQNHKKTKRYDRYVNLL